MKKKIIKKPKVKKKASAKTKKTPTKKKPVKKTSTKKVIKIITKPKKAPSKKVSRLKSAPPEMAFWIHNGPVVNDLKELFSAMKEMNDGQFAYHTQRDGNDFARWVENALESKACAKRIESARDKTAVVRVIKLYI